jgi:hypothetical protein
MSSTVLETNQPSTKESNYEDIIAFIKANVLIEESITREQLCTAKKFMDLFLRSAKDIDEDLIEDLINSWKEKDAALELKKIK